MLPSLADNPMCLDPPGVCKIIRVSDKYLYFFKRKSMLQPTYNYSFANFCPALLNFYNFLSKNINPIII